MSISTELVSPTTASLNASLVRAPEGGTLQLVPKPSEDRREAARVTTVYRPCCVDNGDRAGSGLIRNWSETGAQIETSLPMQLGDTISYFWDTLFSVECTVIWQHNGKVGVEHKERIEMPTSEYPPRTVRIPCSQTARIWVGGVGHDCKLANVSLVGAQLFGVVPIPKGWLVTLEIGGNYFTSCSVRWASDGSMGIQFGKKIRVEQLEGILDVAEEDAAIAC